MADKKFPIKEILSRNVSLDAMKLVGISFLGLFFQLALIRYTNSTVQVINYFNNFMILSAILGLGYGSLRVRQGRDYYKYFPVIAFGVVGLMTFFDTYGYSNVDASQVMWTVKQSASEKNIPIPIIVLLVFSANFMFFVPIGHKLGYYLDRFENRLEGYAYDLLGSVAGVLAFAFLSYLEIPPSGWFLCGGIVAILLMSAGKIWMRAGAIVLLAGVIFTTTLPEKGQWSPYYKVTIRQYVERDNVKKEPLGFAIMVDKMRIQDALHFSPALQNSFLAPWVPYYQLPYQFRKPGDTLILGGGSGNDATLALRHGAERVTVVEIDPVIVGLGYSTHPHQPYRNKKVRIVNDDARSFLRRNREKYDLIIMNALDSHLQLPGLSTLRLESYMYTVEAFRDVRRLMNEKTIFMVHLSSTRKWMGERLYWTLTEAFGKEPVLLTTEGSPFDSIAFAFGPEGIFKIKPANENFVLHVSPEAFKQAQSRTVLATDDWPHLYISHPTLPRTYVIILAIIIILAFIIFRYATPMGIFTGNLHFFLLGAGFMLLETRSITKSAVLFGSTWMVNAVMIGSILGVVFLANLLIWKFKWKIKTNLCYLFLFGGLLLGYFISVDFILQYDWVLRILFAGLWFSFPIFFASIIFSRAFKNVQQPHNAFGANLLGIAVGGVLEYSSMILGLQALYLLALLIYLGAMISAGRMPMGGGIGLRLEMAQRNP